MFVGEFHITCLAIGLIKCLECSFFWTAHCLALEAPYGGNESGWCRCSGARFIAGADGLRAEHCPMLRVPHRSHTTARIEQDAKADKPKKLRRQPVRSTGTEIAALPM